MHQYNHNRFLGEVGEDNVSDLLADDFPEMVGIFVAGHIAAEGIIEEVFDFLLETWKLGDIRESDARESEEVSSGFLGDRDDDRPSDGELVAIMECIFFGVSDHIPINRDESMWDEVIGHSMRIFGEFDNLSVGTDDHLVRSISDLIGIACIPMEHVRIPVDRHVDLWADQGNHLFGIFFSGMPSSMDFGFFVLIDTDLLRHDDIEESLYGSFIPGDNGGTENDGVRRSERGISGFSSSDAHESSIALPLGSGTTDSHLIVSELVCVFHGDEGPRFWLGIAEFDSDLGIIIHPATEENHLAVKFLGGADDDHNPIDNR